MRSQVKESPTLSSSGGSGDGAGVGGGGGVGIGVGVSVVRMKNFMLYAICEVRPGKPPSQSELAPMAWYQQLLSPFPSKTDF